MGPTAIRRAKALRVTRGDQPCIRLFECQPVYPEGGASNEWVYTGLGSCGYDCAPGSCDEGDREVTVCPDGAICYETYFVDDPCTFHILCAETSAPRDVCNLNVEDRCVYPGATCIVPDTCGDITYECVAARDGRHWELIDDECGG
ncbi:MAG: hypothetical protein HOW73_27195 [Polyangiaceae bacterium]|nr:hypothetical protein [Polyangiaceae bacterium]